MTLQDLFISPKGRALFEFEYGESAYRQFSALDVVLLADPLVMAETTDNYSITGRFLCQAEMLAEAHGASTGTFTLTLPIGMHGANEDQILKDAEITIVIETAPFALGKTV